MIRLGGSVDVSIQVRCWDRFLRSEITNVLFNFFENSNEEIMGREQKEEILRSNVGKHRSRRRYM